VNADHRSLHISVSVSIIPRLLTGKYAAFYCGVSLPHFLAHVAPRVAPISIGVKRLWDMKALDRWIDGEVGVGQVSLSPEQWLDRLDGD
jgi:hypothetical protein